MPSIWGQVFEMLKAPFTQALDLKHTFYIVVILLVLGGIVALVLNHIRIAAAVEV